MDQQPPIKRRSNRGVCVAVVLSIAVLIGITSWYLIQTTMPKQIVADPSAPKSEVSTEVPEFTTEVVASKLSKPWDIAFLPDGTALFTEKSGLLSRLVDGQVSAIGTIPEVSTEGEGGLLGLAIDPQFTNNRQIYLCYSTKNDIRVVRWHLDASNTLSASHVIVPGIPTNSSGRHSGCRIAFGPDGYLWIGTGDTAQAGLSPQRPQDPKSLAGKILRVDTDGKAAPNNLGAPFDERIYSYGHRNTQGIAFLPQPKNDIIGYSAEHGSYVDDEVNPLVRGNFGWDPDKAYTELHIPMTDKTKFPDAVDATWSSGDPTQAPSGLEVITGTRWKAWNGALAVAMLKASHLKILTLDANSKVASETKILTDHGRLRDVEQGPDGALYITTDNGTNDEVIKLIPVSH